MATIFDGRAEAVSRQRAVQQQTAQLSQRRRKVKIASLYFSEDAGSVMYTHLKQKVATRAGIQFDGYALPLTTMPIAVILAQIAALANDERVTGIMVQKPMKSVWRRVHPGFGKFDAWWDALTSAIPTAKDIDCLAPSNLASIRRGAWQLLPATVKAALIALESALAVPLTSSHAPRPLLNQLPIVVIGCSDIIGRPLADVLQHLGATVTQYCKPDETRNLRAARVVISATGVPRSVIGQSLTNGTVVIDVGSPVGDVDFASAAPHAKFITPVPGGIGPLTVISLLENAVILALAQARDIAALPHASQHS